MHPADELHATDARHMNQRCNLVDDSGSFPLRPPCVE